MVVVVVVVVVAVVAAGCGCRWKAQTLPPPSVPPPSVTCPVCEKEPVRLEARQGTLWLGQPLPPRCWADEKMGPVAVLTQGLPPAPPDRSLCGGLRRPLVPKAALDTSSWQPGLHRSWHQQDSSQ